MCDPDDGSDEIDTVKVLDFGLVKHVDKAEAEDLTQQGLFMGSPKYMAPEQILGHAVSPATDIYSLGVVAYELLSGRVPFDKGASVKTLMAHVNDPVPALREVNPHIAVSGAMDRLITRCLEKDPDDRFASIDELLHELAKVDCTTMSDSLPVARLPISTAPPPIPQQARVDSSGARTRSWTPPASVNDYEMPHPVSQVALDGNKSNGVVRIGAIATVVAIAAVVFVILSRGDAPADAPLQVASQSPLETPAPPAHSATPALDDTARADSESPEVEPSARVSAPIVRTVRVTSKPSGATVKEKGKVVCGATPCDVTWRDDDATSKHQLQFSKHGFVTTTEEVRDNISELHAQLPVAAQPRATPPATPKTPPSSKPKTVSGYKESPY